MPSSLNQLAEPNKGMGQTSRHHQQQQSQPEVQHQQGEGQAAATSGPSQAFPFPPDLLTQLLGAAMRTPEGQEALRQISARLPVPPQPPQPDEGEQQDGENDS